MSKPEPIEFHFTAEDVKKVRNDLLEKADKMKIPHAQMAVMAAYAANDIANKVGLDIKEITKGLAQ